MTRAILIVLDSFGVGGAIDAAKYNDLGSNTLGHIAEFCSAGLGDQIGLRSGPLYLPNMSSLGLLDIAYMASGEYPAQMPIPERVFGLHGCSDEQSNGKDTPSGHWEIAGTPVKFNWGYFPADDNPFSEELLQQLCTEADVPGILGNCHASGTDVINQFGQAHIQSGMPICYTSVDSVFQIAAHEDLFGLDRLYAFCEIARKVLDPLNIGRVIARPFIGNSMKNFIRTGNRRDYSILPPEPTLLDRLVNTGRKVHAVGKIADIFAQQGISSTLKGNGNDMLINATLEAMDNADDGDLVFTNLVDFDMLYGHRRDVAGYAAALEAFDARLPDIHRKLRQDDIVILTADHGCDPTWRGNDHTRERVPIMVFGPGIRSRNIGIRTTFSDIGETIAQHLGIEAGSYGRSFL